MRLGAPGGSHSHLLPIAEGKPVTLVKEALGHAVLATTMRYTHLAKRHLKTLVEKPQ